MLKNNKYSQYDMIILGAGPAGLTLAHHLCNLGHDVLCISALMPLKWPANYGIWLADLPSNQHHWIEHIWETPAVRWQNDQPWFYLDHPYCKLNNDVMIQTLQHPQLCIEQGWVECVELQDDDIFTIQTRTASHSKFYQTPVLIDATGHQSKFIEYQDSTSPGFQTAYGAAFSRHDAPPMDLARGMILMDYSKNNANTPPSFLYAMSFETSLFVEETVLVSKPPVTRDILEQRLKQRLNITSNHIITEEEWCVIPMGTNLPILSQPILGYGGAASMVHPATGYQMAQVFNWAKSYADCISAHINSALSVRSKAAWSTLWSSERQRQRALYMYGMDVLVDLDLQQTQTFFAAFFAQPASDWQRYLSWSLSSKTLAGIMLSLFGNLSPSMKLDLMRPAFSSSARHLLRALGST